MARSHFKWMLNEKQTCGSQSLRPKPDNYSRGRKNVIQRCSNRIWIKQNINQIHTSGRGQSFNEHNALFIMTYSIIKNLKVLCSTTHYHAIISIQNHKVPYSTIVYPTLPYMTQEYYIVPCSTIMYYHTIPYYSI